MPELLTARRCRPDFRQLRKVAVASRSSAFRIMRRWVSGGPIFQVPDGLWCDQTFVRSQAEMEYIEAMNGLPGGHILLPPQLPSHAPGGPVRFPEG